jgi:type VI protein secretion system component Hcp
MRNQIIRLIKTGLLMVCLLWGNAFAAIYLCAGPEIKGDVTAKGYEECIAIDSFEDGVERPLDPSVPEPRPEAPEFSSIVLTKSFDSSSLSLRREAAVGEARDMAIHFVTEGASQCEYYKIELTHALLLSHSTSNSVQPYESLSMIFGRVMYTHYSFESGDCQSPTMTTWGYDLRSGESL